MQLKYLIIHFSVVSTVVNEKRYFIEIFLLRIIYIKANNHATLRPFETVKTSTSLFLSISITCG